MSFDHCNVCAQCKQHPCTCIDTNFWILPESGRNLLKGCCCDPDNPVRLQDCFILHALQNSMKARDDFCKLYPSLFPCEQERFDLLFEENPLLSKLRECTTEISDTFQRRMNDIPVHTAGPGGAFRVPRGGGVTLPPHLLSKRQPQKCK